MPSGDSFSTKLGTKQAEIAHGMMNIYKSNPKGHGFALKEGLKRDDNNNKWKPKALWAWKEAGELEWCQHLNGERFLGLGPNFDNAEVWWACIDVDQLDGVKYEMDYITEMEKLRRSELPLVPDRSKNGGFHLKAFFSEPISCAIARNFLSMCASLLGYAKSEIFPKQIGELKEKEDCPNWVFVPYGPTWDVFGEQCGMSLNGGALTIEEYIDVCNRNRLSLHDIEGLMKNYSDKKQQNGSGQRRSNIPKGVFILDAAGNADIKDVYKGGPPCLRIIAHLGATELQHDVLFENATFVKKKFPDNWEQALDWVNLHVLHPPGDPERLKELKKSHSKASYNYRCNQSPICDYCDSHACRLQPYGVGSSVSNAERYEFGLIIVDKEPREFYANIADKRVSLSAKELMSQDLFNQSCLAVGVTEWPDKVTKREWEKIVQRALGTAQTVPPSKINRTQADEWEMLEEFLRVHIANHVRADRGGALKGEGKNDDSARIVLEEKRIYFKDRSFHRFIFQVRRELAKGLRHFIDRNTVHHTQEKGSGIRGWYRGTYS
jgi:hypothetical protein